MKNWNSLPCVFESLEIWRSSLLWNDGATSEAKALHYLEQNFQQATRKSSVYDISPYKIEEVLFPI
jgi:hypothetical protein